MAATTLPPRAPGVGITVGRTFIGPGFDVMIIGGGLTIPIALWTSLHGASALAALGASFPIVALIVNQAHFAASTVRLYTKPNSFRDLPFLTMVFPVVTLAVLTGFIFFANSIGWHLQALYLSWSPYHYAAQTFGLATMYCIRSGCRLDPFERNLLRLTCLLPFFKAFLDGAPGGYGLGWLVPFSLVRAHALAFDSYLMSRSVLGVLTLAAPVALFVGIHSRRRAASLDASEGGSAQPAMPLISLFLILSNGVWWVLFSYWDALAWATVLHGLQYMAIIAIFYADDRMRAPTNRHGRPFHMAVLYAICIVVGYALFQCWPRAYMLAGFGMVESMLLVVAVINIHHFIVDGFIWKIRKDRNLKTVMA